MSNKTNIKKFSINASVDNKGKKNTYKNTKSSFHMQKKIEKMNHRVESVEEQLGFIISDLPNNINDQFIALQRTKRI